MKRPAFGGIRLLLSGLAREAGLFFTCLRLRGQCVDVVIRGVDTDVVDTIARHVTNDERQMVEGWLHQERHAKPGSTWRNQGLESFLVK